MIETLSTDYFRPFYTDAAALERKKRRLEKDNGGGDNGADNAVAKNGAKAKAVTPFPQVVQSP